MQFSSKTRVRNAIWVRFILGTIYLAPHLAAYCPCNFLLSFSEAISAEIENDLYIGSAVGKFPILVPPGRGGLSPNILLDYSSYRGNGWIGVGWDFNMGAIQRSTKKGVKYDANDYLSVMNGSSSELVPRTDWCTTCFGAKIEGAYARYYFNPSTNGWEVRTKDGKKHYFGTSPESRQDNIYGIFKWCLDRVEDTNGNFMTIIYLKHEGEIYLNRIDYTGNAGLSPTNSVLFYLEGRLDAPSMFNTNADVKTALRLKTIDVFAGGNRVRKYELEYDADQTQPEFQYSSGTGRSLLGTVKIFGDDGRAQLPPMTFGWSAPSPGFNATAQWALRLLFWSAYGSISTNTL